MATITVRRAFAHPLAEVWAQLRAIERHVEWMRDAESITFTTDQREGVGTTFVCATRVGPFRLRDVMTVTAWVEGSTIGVAHEGLVTGDGTFTVASTPTGTAMTWRERLAMPWYVGGPLAAACAAPVLWLIWRANLVALGRRLDADPR